MALVFMSRSKSRRSYDKKIYKKVVISLKILFIKKDLHVIKGLRESKNYSSRQSLQNISEKHWKLH